MLSRLDRFLINLKLLLSMAIFALGIVSSALLIYKNIPISETQNIKISYLVNGSAQEPSVEIFRVLSQRLVKLDKSGLIPARNFWFEIKADVPGNKSAQIVEIRQLRGSHLSIWEIQKDKINPNNISFNPITFKANRSGIVIDSLDGVNDEIDIIGIIDAESIVKPQIIIKEKKEYLNYSIQDNRLGGLLFGIIIGLSVFSSVIALINRDRSFIYLSALLFTTIRIFGFNYGWDLRWIGWDISEKFIPVVKNISLQLHIFLSLALFENIFKGQLRNQGSKTLFEFFYLSYITIIFVGLFLPSKATINFIWFSGFATIVLVFFLLAKIVSKTWSLIIFWYSLSWVLTGLGMIGEILNALGLASSITKLINSQVAAISSILLVGIALSTKLQLERYERINAQNNAIFALQRFRQNYNSTPIGIFSIKLNGNIVEHNPAFFKMFQEYTIESSLVGADSARLFKKDLVRELDHCQLENSVLNTEFQIDRSTKNPRWFHIRAFQKFDRYEIWIEDISPRKEAEAKLRFLVNHDSLTGILNRRGIESVLKEATEATRERVMCLAYIDLDRFKLVNDLFGHATGDQILSQMAARLRSVISSPHVPARVGGDEFIVIIDSLPLDEARALCERLRAVLSHQPYHVLDKAFTVSASIGVIRILPGMTPADALTASDRACAEAKRTGGRSVVCFDSGSSELSDYLEEIRIVAQIKDRLPIENFFLVFQPIISLRQPDAGLSYEALIRMRDANGVIQSPARFIPAAERNGLMTQIDRWVLRDMLEWLDEHPQHRERLDFCTLNLSGASLNDEKFLQDTIALIRDHRQSSRKICFEITESIALYDLNTTRRFVDSVKFLGAKVALDDFGAGYTSFSYLKELPADFVKIDGNFIKDLNSDTANYAIAHAIVELTRKLGMICIAEWAENDDIVRSLIDLQVDYAQGFGLCGPIEREKILMTKNAITLIRNRSTTRLVLNAAIAHSRKFGGDAASGQKSVRSAEPGSSI